MLSKVTPVSKVHDADSAAQVRPITVMSLIYRIWGRVTTKGIATAWAASFPSAVSGFLPGRSAEQLLYHLQHRLELIHSEESPATLGGLTLDLVKCYNQVPRYPGRLALLKLQVPPRWVNIWFQSLQMLQRWWVLNGHLVPCDMSSTGIPEGDSWSVLTMLALNRLYVSHLQCDGVYVNAFADNWSYAADPPDAHEEAITRTIDLTTSLRVQIDWEKTWGWGTTPRHIAALRRAAQHVRPDLQLQIATNARELGYILHYRRQQFRGTQKKRHDQARARLKKMSYHGYSVTTMAQLAQQAVLPKAFFGVHIYVPGQHYFDEMRTSLCQALCPGGNANPKLVIASMADKLMDPEVYVILQALRAARRYLHSATDDWKQSFLSLASRRPLEAQQITGPARALRHYVQRLGWSITKQGNLLIDPWTSVSLVNMDFGLLKLLVERDWAEDISRSLTRNHWRNAPALDCSTTVNLCKTFNDTERACLVRELSGGFLLQSRKAKFNDDLDESCPLCGQEDSTEHRVLYCPALEEARLRHCETIQWLQEMGPIHLHLPFAFQHADSQMTSTLLRAQPMPDLHFATSCTSRPRFYTDGSCLHPSHPQIRWAAFGIVQDLRNPTDWSYEDLLHPPEDRQMFHVVAVGLCPGRQTIQRAELEAVTLLLEHDTDIDVYTDSAYVIAQTEKILKGAPLSDFSLQPNYDQLQRLYMALHATERVPGIWKVQAHQQIDNTLAYDDLLHATGNNYVDEVAKRAVNTLGGPFQTALRQQAADYLELRKQLSQHLRLRLDLNNLRTLRISQQNQPPVDDESDTESALHRLVTWQVHPPFWTADCNLRDDRVLFASFWGFEFSSLVHQWLSLLTWPAEPDSFAGKTPVGITWTELAINFLLVTQRLIPINTSCVQGKPCYEVPRPDNTLTEDQMTLGKMTDSLRNCTRQMVMLHPKAFLPTIKTRTVRSLYMLNGDGYVHGFSRRPQMPYQNETMKSIMHWLRSRDELAYPPILNVPPLLLPWSQPDEFGQWTPMQMYNQLRMSNRPKW